MNETATTVVANTIATDLPIAISKLNDVKTIFSQVNDMVRSIIKRVKNNELPTAQGMSFLDIKNQLLLKYLLNLNCILLRKVSGESIAETDCLDRLIEIRTTLERVRPVEQKLKYQIEKLLKLAIDGKFSQNDPLQFKANPNNLVSKVQGADEDEDSDDDTKGKEKKSGVYVPPKLISMKYDDDTPAARATKVAEKANRIALSSSALQHLKEEYMDTPMEIVESSANGTKMNIARERQERQEYEEAYFTRLPYTKQERHSSRQQYSSTALGNELAGLSTAPTKKRKVPSGKKKGFMKRRKQ